MEMFMLLFKKPLKKKPAVDEEYYTTFFLHNTKV